MPLPTGLPSTGGLPRIEGGGGGEPGLFMLGPVLRMEKQSDGCTLPVPARARLEANDVGRAAPVVLPREDVQAAGDTDSGPRGQPSTGRSDWHGGPAGRSRAT